MARRNAGQHRPETAQPELPEQVSCHHISSIAHLFFDEAEIPEASQLARNSQHFMVFSAGASPVSAVATAGLSMGSEGCSFCGRVILRENQNLPWSSSSFLKKSLLHLMGPAGSGENGGDGSDLGSAWLIKAPKRGSSANLMEQNTLNRTVRWFHAGCAADSVLKEMEAISGSKKWGRQISGAADGLVWCLLEKEAVSLIAAYQLGRLISLLKPKQVEILIFPDSWSKTGKPIWQRKVFQGRHSASEQEALVNRCRTLATAVGDCRVSLMPESLGQSSNQSGSSGGVLKMIATRMLGED